MSARAKIATQSAVERALAAMRRAWSPPPRLLISEWACRYRYLSPEASAEPGLWNNARAPHLVKPMDCLSPYSPTDRVVCKLSSQTGKALAVDTPIPTPSGWTAMGDLVPGDVVFDERGEQCHVTFATDAMHGRKCYMLTFSDGSKIVADADHLWYVESGWFAAKTPGIVTTQTIAEDYRRVFYGQTRNRYAIPVAASLQCAEADLPIDPYLLGVWLGDGCSYRAAITVGAEDADFMEAELRRIDPRFERIQERTVVEMRYSRSLVYPEGECRRGHVLADVGVSKGGYCAECQRQHSNISQRPERHVMDPVIHRSVGQALIDLGLTGFRRKTIPPCYLRASHGQRLALLQGLMDTDGHISPSGRCQFVSTQESLVIAVVELVRSLGLKPGTLARKTPQTVYKGVRVEGHPAFLFEFTAYNDLPVFRLPRKLARQKPRNRGRVTETLRRRIVDVQEVPSAPVKCIQVDSPNRLYLAGTGMIPTHNTEIILNFVGYIIDLDPGPILAIQPNVTPMGEAFSKDRVSPMLRDSPSLAGKIGEVKARNSAQTITHKKFPGGHLTIAGANSPAGLASRPIRYLVCDEIDRWEITKEGDPLLLARKRLQTFRARRSSKELIVSSPTYEDVGICVEYAKCSQQWEWHFACLHCGQTQFPRLDHFHHQGDPRALRYVCIHCGSEHPLGQADRVKAGGRWVCIKDEGPEAVGFWMNQWASPFARWDDTLTEWLTSQDDPAQKQAVVNTAFAEPWEGEGEKVEPHVLSKRAEAYPAEVPAGGLVLTIGVDVQGDRLEAEVVAWGRDLESWSIAYEVLPGEPTSTAVWEDLLDLYRTPWKHESGVELRPLILCVDSGAYTQHVYDFVARSKESGIIPIKGASGMSRDAVSGDHRQRIKRTQRRRREGRPPEILGVDNIKRTVFHHLTAPSGAPGYCHFPVGRSEEYYLQLTGERLTVVSHRNRRPERHWVPIHPAVEALDCRVYAYAALLLSNRHHELMNQTKPPEPSPSLDKTEAPVYSLLPEQPKASRIKRRSSSWL